MLMFLGNMALMKGMDGKYMLYNMLLFWRGLVVLLVDVVLEEGLWRFELEKPLPFTFFHEELIMRGQLHAFIEGAAPMTLVWID